MIVFWSTGRGSMEHCMQPFSLGQNVVTTQPIVIRALDITIERGELGTIVDIDPDTGWVCLQLRQYHDGPAHRRNIILVRDPAVIEVVEGQAMTKNRVCRG
jgi:hypothetical protein